MIAKEVYIKKLETRDGYDIWLVDGARIRKDVDENFVEYDHNGRFRFIPAHELWIDQEMPEKEYALFIERMFKELGFIKEGLSPLDAAHKADTFETDARRNGARIKKLLLDQNQNTIREKIHKKKLAEWSNEFVSVWLVDGTLVRGCCDIVYSEGGHDIVYPWIPKGEIWIEESLDAAERTFIILHELHERALMQQGMSYPDAHHGATIVEDKFREHPEGLEERIKEELAKNK